MDPVDELVERVKYLSHQLDEQRLAQKQPGGGAGQDGGGGRRGTYNNKAIFISPTVLRLYGQTPGRTQTGCHQPFQHPSCSCAPVHFHLLQAPSLLLSLLSYFSTILHRLAPLFHPRLPQAPRRLACSLALAYPLHLTSRGLSYVGLLRFVAPNFASSPHFASLHSATVALRVGLRNRRGRLEKPHALSLTTLVPEADDAEGISRREAAFQQLAQESLSALPGGGDHHRQDSSSSSSSSSSQMSDYRYLRRRLRSSRPAVDVRVQCLPLSRPIPPHRKDLSLDGTSFQHLIHWLAPITSLSVLFLLLTPCSWCPCTSSACSVFRCAPLPRSLRTKSGKKLKKVRTSTTGGTSSSSPAASMTALHPCLPQAPRRLRSSLTRCALRVRLCSALLLTPCCLPLYVRRRDPCFAALHSADQTVSCGGRWDAELSRGCRAPHGSGMTTLWLGQRTPFQHPSSGCAPYFIPVSREHHVGLLTRSLARPRCPLGPGPLFLLALPRLAPFRCAPLRQYTYAKRRENSSGRIRVPVTIFLPDTNQRLVWDILILFLVVLYAVLVPFRIAFYKGAPYPVETYVDIAADCLFGIDIIVNFRTTYKKDGRWVTDGCILAWRYFRSWFFIDCISTVPINIMVESVRLTAQQQWGTITAVVNACVCGGREHYFLRIVSGSNLSLVVAAGRHLLPFIRLLQAANIKASESSAVRTNKLVRLVRLLKLGRLARLAEKMRWIQGGCWARSRGSGSLRQTSLRT